jgi:hypothetical protein
MLVLYFCLNDAPPVLRYWSAAPRIGDAVVLEELGGNRDPLRVYDVIWEGTEEPSVSVYVHHARVQHPICTEVSNRRRHTADGSLFLRQSGTIDGS